MIDLKRSNAIQSLIVSLLCFALHIIGSKDRSVTCWRGDSTDVEFTLRGHKNSVISVAVHPERALFATGSGDFRARIWRKGTAAIEPKAGLSLIIIFMIVFFKKKFC